MNEGLVGLELWTPVFEWLRWISLSLGFVCFISFAWAIKRLFIVSPDGVRLPMKFLGYLGIAFYVMHVMAIYRGPVLHLWAPAVGVVGYLAALALFWWAVPSARAARLAIAFDPAQPAFVQGGGPYAYIRHPFYASYFLFWLAGVFSAENAWLTLTVLVMAVFYANAIRQEEAELEKGALGERYATYKACTPALIPGISTHRRRTHL